MILGEAAPALARQFGSGLYYSCSLAETTRASWAWVADTHINADAGADYRGWRPAARLERIVREIAAAEPNGVLINGDISWSVGSTADYLRFQSIVRPVLESVPFVIGVGNHDRRDNMLAVLGNRKGPGPDWMAAVVHQPPFRFVQLDSQIDPQHVGGEIGDQQLEWLDQVLQAESTPRTILFVHHPGESTSAGCRDFDLLAGIAERHRCIEAIVTAHDHAFALERVSRVHRIALPAAGFPFDPQIDCGWIEAQHSRDGLSLAFHGQGGTKSYRLAWR